MDKVHACMFQVAQRLEEMIIWKGMSQEIQRKLVCWRQRGDADAEVLWNDEEQEGAAVTFRKVKLFMKLQAVCLLVPGYYEWQRHIASLSSGNKTLWKFHSAKSLLVAWQPHGHKQTPGSHCVQNKNLGETTSWNVLALPLCMRVRVFSLRLNFRGMLRWARLCSPSDRKDVAVNILTHLGSHLQVNGWKSTDKL